MKCRFGRKWFAPERAKVIELLAERNVQARPLNPCLAASPHVNNAGPFPNAERFAALGLTLPSGPDQTEANLERTVAALVDIAAHVDTPIDSLFPPPNDSQE